MHFVNKQSYSIRKKFDVLSGRIKGNVGVFVISEKKIDGSFPMGQFKIEGFATVSRLDRNCFIGRVIACVWEDIPPKYLYLERSIIEGFLQWN